MDSRLEKIERDLAWRSEENRYPSALKGLGGQIIEKPGTPFVMRGTGLLCLAGVGRGRALISIQTTLN